MAKAVDFFFSSYVTPWQQRYLAALADGIAHGAVITPRDPQPDVPVTLQFTTAAVLPIERVAIYYTTDGSEPQGERGIATNGTALLVENGELSRDDLSEQPVYHWHATLPGQPDGTLVRYRADAWSLTNPTLHRYADDRDPIGAPPVHGRRFAYSVDRWQPPEWVRDAVIYHIFVDRFNAAHDERPMRDPGSITGFYGGTLRGIIEKLDYIQSLGANCIWLSPVFESPTHHGYNPSSYETVAHRYGTNETLRQLIAASHQRGIRVILDFVANHTSDEHPLFREGRRDPQGPAGRMYTIGDWPPYGYRAYAAVRDMPELATERPEVRHYLTDAARSWIGSFGADGLRLDYMAGPSHAFWTEFQRGIKQHYPDALTLGEITDTPKVIATYAGRIDGFMDFPLSGMLRRVFAQRSAPLSDLLAFLVRRAPVLPAEMCRATLLDNHDSHRFLWLAEGDTRRLQLASLCQMTLDGMPIVYYGTEVGLSQYGDAHKENAYARAPMFWEEGFQDRHLLEHYRHLIALRHAHPALRSGDFTPLAPHLDDDAATSREQVGAYLRHQGDDRLLVALNNTQQRVSLTIPLDDIRSALGGTPTIKLTPRVAYATTPPNIFTLRDAAIHLELWPLSAVILTL
jgi:cyclomaltodextrinase / maltogenic alpha-amylase / neopullulanase